MATLKKYITEQIDIFDKTKTTIYRKHIVNETEDITESVKASVTLPPHGLVTPYTLCQSDKGLPNKCSTTDTYYYVGEGIGNSDSGSAGEPIYSNYRTCYFPTINPLEHKFTCEDKITKVHTDDMLWIYKVVNGQVLDRTNFVIINTFVTEDITYYFRLVSSYNQKLKIVRINSMWDIEFTGMELAQQIEAKGVLDFGVFIKSKSPYLKVQNEWLSFRVQLEDGTEFDIAFLIYIERVPYLVGFLAHPDKSGYSETFFYQTYRFESANGIWYDKSIMDKPKMNASVRYTQLDKYKLGYMQNVMMESTYRPTWLPLWSEGVTLLEEVNYESILRVSRVPQQLSLYNYLYLELTELKGVLVQLVNVIDDHTIQILNEVKAPAGCKIYPVFQMVVTNSPNITREFATKNNMSGMLTSKGFIYDLQGV